MISLDLSAIERYLFEIALADSHRVRITTRLFDRNEDLIGSLGGQLLEGSIQVDTSAAVRRVLTCTVLDPRHTIRFEPDSPAEGAVHAENFVGILYGIFVPLLSEWVDVPVFMGPITKVERQGAVARIEAQGKERLMLAPHNAGRGYTLRKGMRTDAAIEAVARRSGELRFNLPDLPKRLPHARSVGPETEPWLVINGGDTNAKGKVLTGLIDRAGGDAEVYYDGRGELVARRRFQPTTFTFTHNRHLLGAPTITYDVTEFRNTVIVRGGKRKKKPRAHARVSLPGSHPLSPISLARNGKPRYLIEFVDADGAKTDAACKARARATLDRVARQGVSASFDSLPVPHLEENDQVGLYTPDIGLVTFPLREFTLPLIGGDSMSVGATKAIRG